MWADTISVVALIRVKPTLINLCILAFHVMGDMIKKMYATGACNCKNSYIKILQYTIAIELRHIIKKKGKTVSKNERVVHKNDISIMTLLIL